MKFTFPDVGEGITEGEIVQWHVDVGEEIERDQTLVEVETDKAIVDIPSPVAGRVTSLNREVGETIEVGEVLVEIDTGEEPAEEEKPQREETLALGGEESTTVVGSLSTEAEVLEEEEAAEAASGKVLATPATRRLARELDVVLEDVTSTGEQGRVTEEDVRRHAEQAGAVARDTDEYGPIERRTLSATRRVIAERMRKSAREIPHATHTDSADITALYERIHDGNPSADTKGEARLTLTPFLVKAAVAALREFPRLNSSLNDQNQTVVLKKYYNIGVSVDTEHGLMVPVIRDAEDKTVRAVASELAELVERARNRTIQLEELRGSTFTVTNVGIIGGKWVFPKINYPEAAILGVGRARREAVVRGDTVVPRRVLPLSVAFDHRILDGAEVARFTNHIIGTLERPESFSTES